MEIEIPYEKIKEDLMYEIFEKYSNSPNLRKKIQNENEKDLEETTKKVINRFIQEYMDDILDAIIENYK